METHKHYCKCVGARARAHTHTHTHTHTRARTHAYIGWRCNPQKDVTSLTHQVFAAWSTEQQFDSLATDKSLALVFVVTSLVVMITTQTREVILFNLHPQLGC